MRLVAEGFSNREIARELVVSPRTIQSHVAAAMRKTGARSRAHLAAIAVRRGIAQPTEQDDDGFTERKPCMCE